MGRIVIPPPEPQREQFETDAEYESMHNAWMDGWRVYLRDIRFRSFLVSIAIVAAGFAVGAFLMAKWLDLF